MQAAKKILKIPKNILYKIKNHEYIHLLYKNPPFRYVFISGIISRIGDFLTNIALGTILELKSSGTKYNGLSLSFLVISFILPALLFSNVGGVFADLADKRAVMLTSDLLRSMVVLLFIFVEDNTLLLFMVLFTKETLASFFNSSKEGLIPVTVPECDLDIANALDALMWMSCSFLGATLGGMIMVAFGSKVSYILNSVTYIISAICVMLLIFAMRSQARSHRLEESQPDSVSEDEIENDVESNENLSLEEDSGEKLPRKTPPEILTPIDDEVPLKPSENSTMIHATEKDSLIDSSTNETENNNSKKKINKKHLSFKEKISPRNICNQIISIFRFILSQIFGFFYGILFLFTNPYLLSMTFVKGMQVSVWGPLDILLIIFSNGKYKIKNSSVFLSLTRAAMGLASGISPILMERIFRPKSALAMRRVISFTWVLMSIGSIIVFLSIYFDRNGLYFFIIGSAIYAYGAGQVWVYSTIILQKSTPTNYVGRVLAFDMGFMNSGFEISLALITGSLIDFAHVSYDTILLGLVIISFVFTFGWAIHYFIFLKIKEPYKPFWLFNSMKFSGLNEEEKEKLLEEIKETKV